MVEEASVQANGPIPVIIQMRDEPILARRNAVAALGVQERAQQLRQHQDRLVDAQSQLKTWIRTLEPGQRDEAFRHYRFAFNGMAAKVSPETLKKLKQRPDVARVFRDGTAKATVTTSVPLIGAPQMWSDYGANGQGIRVAVIDTGIDYTHPDLGGGFGPGFKVMGGYDFINGDADPMDDYGHGTHVAGIIAANGTLKGVAPGARLLAYKVLGADGSGPYSAIIAGIDRAVDPDQDPTTNDGAQVINLSLGGPGDPDDAISQAVDAAVSAGVVCVVAAGNSGSSYATLGSPGCARKALTVGASDDLDVMASFSSRGPSRPDFSIKPDLTAPGVSITSTVPGGGYQSMSGTSMATPHVAGAAALLLQLHPGWTPELVKAVLAERAKNLGQDAFTQGGGRIQVVASHLAKGVALPNNLNFGMVDLGQGIWTRSLPVRLRNLDAASRTYALAMQGSAVAGATWSVSPTSVTLAAGQSQDVTLTLTVDNSALPFGPPPTMAYEAKLVASASDDTFSIPAVYYKAAQLDLQFAQVPWYVFIFDQNADPNDGFSYEMRSGAPSLSFMLPPRKYDVICHFMMGPQGTYAESYVVREGIDLTSKQTLNINLDQEVLQHFVFKSFDGGGHEILFDSLRTKAVEREFRHSSGMGTTTFGGYSDWYFSNASSSYVFDQVRSGWAMDGDVNKYYEFRYALKDGINQSQTINNAPAQRVDLKYNIDPAVDYIWIDFYRYKNAPQMAVGMSSGEWARSGEIPPWVLSKPFRMEAHLSSLPYPGFTFNQSAPFVSRYDGGLGAGPRLMIGGLLGVRDGGVIGAHLMFSPDSPFYTTSSGRMVIGESPHLWTGRLFFYSQGSALIQSAYGGVTPLYLGQSGDGTVGDLPYELLQNGSPVRSGVIPGSGSPATSTNLDFAPGAYVLKVPYASYVVAGQRGHALATITFDSTKVDPAPPFLKRAAVLRDGVATSITTPGSLNQLSLQVGDTFGLTQVQASYQTTGGWVPLPLPLLSGPLAQCVVDLPAGLPEGPVNLKVTAADGQGNALTQEWAPAFYHSALTAPGITAQPQDVTVASGQPATFSVAAIGVGPLSYQWRKNGAVIGGATSSSYTTIPVATDDAARFSVVVTDAQGSVPSNEAILTVLTPPNLSTQPRSLGVMVGQTATFTVTATGTGPLSYQWRKNAVSISGATSSSYTTPPVTMADDGAAFSVVVTNAQGGVTSNDATLTVLTAPNLSAQPQSLSVAPGQTATFSVTATGTAPLSYQWRKGGVPIGGATSSRYTTPPATMADDGALFSVVVTNGQGSVTSDDAKLTVQASGPTVEVQPGTLGCFPGDTIVFSAKVTNAADNRVTWKASAGTIDDTGRFAAPGAPGTVTITATSVQDPSRTGTATVTVRGTDFDGNTALNPRLLGLAHAMGSTAPADLAKYDFNGDGRIDDADLAKLYQKMGW
jgi:subtilisin family serine protease